jgi:hypothetical protein
MKLSDDLIDRFDVAALLNVTMTQLIHLSRSPVFPKPTGIDALRKKAEVEWFKRTMDEARQRGWKLPEALYPWEE